VRAAGETETTQENIQDWLELDEGDPGFQLLTEEEIAAVIFVCLFSLQCGSIHPLPHTPSWRSAYLVKHKDNFTFYLPTLLNFPFICFLSSLCLLGLSFASLIRIIA
jgi:hypothetical protein